MPDRDEFNALKPHHRPAAKEFVRIARGEESDLLKIAESFNISLQGGVPSLGVTRQLLERQGSSFQGLGFKQFHIQELRDLNAQHGFIHANDKLLHREAVRACERGISEPHEVIRQFLWSVVEANIIDVKRGVGDQLRKEEVPLDRTRLKEAVSPLLDTAAALMLRRPNFKRLGLASSSWRAVDIHENLLGALS